MTKTIDKTTGFEDALEQLNQTVQTLESGDLQLEQALAQFEHGLKLSQHCQQILNKTEQQVKILMEDNQTLEPFETE
jgi:exodeoxyribonuclease VII small subunit